MSELTEKQVKDCKNFLDRKVEGKDTTCNSCALIKQFPELSREKASEVINKWVADSKVEPIIEPEEKI